MVIDERNRRLTSSSPGEIRVWELKSPPITRVSAMSCSIFNVQPSADLGRAAFDCNDGGAWLWSRAAGTVTRLHRHASLSFGVQWLGDEVCSGGWDRKILCTTPGGATRTISPDAGRIMWLDAGPRHDFLAFATSDGRVWKLDDAIHPLYAHNAIAYRVAVSPDGARLASVDLDGTLIVYDLAAGRVTARAMAHAGAIRSLTWQDDGLWTSGVDGALRQWHASASGLSLISQVHETTRFRLTHVFPGGWAANVGTGVLLVGRTGAPAPLRLEVGRPIDDIDVSPHSRYVAVSSLGEVVIIDLGGSRLATVPIDSTPIGYVGFVDNATVAVSAQSALKLIHLEQLDYIPF
jgi:hypothetical protein